MFPLHLQINRVILRDSTSRLHCLLSEERKNVFKMTNTLHQWDSRPTQMTTQNDKQEQLH